MDWMIISFMGKWSTHIFLTALFLTLTANSISFYKKNKEDVEKNSNFLKYFNFENFFYSNSFLLLFSIGTIITMDIVIIINNFREKKFIFSAIALGILLFWVALNYFFFLKTKRKRRNTNKSGNTAIITIKDLSGIKPFSLDKYKDPDLFKDPKG